MNAVPPNQTVSFTTFIQAVGNAALVPADFLRSQDARITAAFDMGEPVWMVVDEMKLRYRMTSFKATKTPRQLAARVVAF